MVRGLRQDLKYPEPQLLEKVAAFSGLEIIQSFKKWVSTEKTPTTGRVSSRCFFWFAPHTSITLADSANPVKTFYKTFFKSRPRSEIKTLKPFLTKEKNALENRSIQLGQPVQNQSIDFTGAFVVGTVACFGNGNKFDRSPIIDQILINFTTCDRCPGVICAPKYQ